MQGTSRVARLSGKDAVAVVVAAVLLSGCVATSSKYRDRIGDFNMHIGSAADHAATTPAAARSAATAGARASGVG